MFTGMDHLLSQGRRAGLAREGESGRLEREARAGRRPRRERLRAFWLPGEIEVAAGTRPPPKIRRLQDTGALART